MAWLDQFVGSFGTSSDGTFFFGNLFSKSGKVTPDSAHRHTAVFACNRIIGEGIGGLSLKLYTKTETGWNKDEEHPLYRLLRWSPNPFMTAMEWKEYLATDLNIRSGNHYSQIVRNNAGDIMGLYPLISSNAKPHMRENGEVVFVYQAKKGKIVLNQDEVFHVKGLPGTNPLEGINPIEYNSLAIEHGMAAEEHGRKFFENGANPSGVIHSTQQAAPSLTDEAYNRLRDSFTENYAGMANSGKPILVEEGYTFTPVTISNKDSQHLETRKFQQAQIASIYRVQLHLINDLTNSNYSNMEQQSMEHVQYTLMPWCIRIEQAIKTQLISKDEQKTHKAEFNIGTLLRGDYKTRQEGNEIMWRSGALSHNEWRAMEKMNSLGSEGDKRYVQLSYTTTDKLQENQKEVGNV